MMLEAKMAGESQNLQLEEQKTVEMLLAFFQIYKRITVRRFGGIA